jgi:lipopolysaccharide biosynthesis glycosyltransferase
MSMGDIHVVLAADANYAMPLSVVMVSAAINCSSDRHLCIHVIESDYDDELKHRVTSALTKARPENLSVHWYPVLSEELSDLPIVQSHISLMTYSRLLIPQLLPSTVHRALYLDCDVLVEGDIAQLWDESVSEKALCAARDRIGCVGNQGGLSNYQELNISADTPYFNAGVLLLNLDKWRRESISQHVFRYLRRYNSLLRFEDQEALNAVLHDDWSEISVRWNQQILPRFFRAGSNVALPNLIENGIIHFITGEKPWLAGCEYVERKRFYAYLDRTNWCGWRIKRRDELYVRSKRVMGDLWRSLRQ